MNGIKALVVSGLVIVVTFGVVSCKKKPLAIPPAQMAAPKPSHDCKPPSTVGLKRIKALNASVKGGYYKAPAVVLKKGVTIVLDSTLVLIAENSIDIQGTITVPPPIPSVIPIFAPAAPVSVILYCEKGSINVSGHIGPLQPGRPHYSGIDVRSPAGSAVAVSGAGSYAGVIKMAAPIGSINIPGMIRGFEGGWGGKAVAAPIAKPGSAVAVGGQGGAGGDVLMCAYEGIYADGSIYAGKGGQGGEAEAYADFGERARAIGGKGNDGGDLIFVGMGPNTEVALKQFANGGHGGDGGDGTADTPWWTTPVKKGVDAKAWGEDAGNGGSVRFSNCKVSQWRWIYAGDGGDGGWGEANGGPGENNTGGIWLYIPFSGSARTMGYSGGDAEAVGGMGGTKGVTPSIPLVSSATVQGFDGTGGIGGSADACQGSGGSGYPGGFTGSARARAGVGGQTGTPPVSKRLGPMPGMPGVFSWKPSVPNVPGAGGTGNCVNAPGVR